MRTQGAALSGRVAIPFLFLLAVLAPSAFAVKFYPLDGIPGSGQSGQAFVRAEVKSYNASMLTLATLPSPRSVSLTLTSPRGEMVYPEKTLSKKFTTSMLTYFGQMVSHDMNYRVANASDLVLMDIPANDVWYRFGNTTRSWRLDRDMKVDNKGVSSTLNEATASVDLSFLYTPRAKVLDKMRTKKDGQLIMDKNGRDVALAVEVFTEADLVDYGEWLTKFKKYPNMRVVGDVRGNQNPGALALRTLFFRNHNRLALERKKDCPACVDEELFQFARRWNIASFQAITFYEYVPQLGVRLPTYNGYKPNVDPGVDNFFSTVSYRYGHSEVTDTLWRLNDDGTEAEEGHLGLAESYWRPGLVVSAGIEKIIRGMAVQLQGEVEPHFSTAIQQHLFGPATLNGTDLCAINIFRGREHGLPLYNDARKEFGLRPHTAWNEVTNDTDLQQVLATAYPGGPNMCDSYICGLAESKVNESHFGELFYASMYSQYLRSRDGDPLYFENDGPDGPGFYSNEIEFIKSMTMRSLILNNTQDENQIRNLPRNIWNTGGASNLGLNGAGGSTGGFEDINPFTRSLLGGKYVLTWQKFGKEMEITVNVSTRGWVGFGIARNDVSGMLGADMVIASRATVDETSPWLIGDYYSTARSEVPVQDSKRRQGFNDVLLVSHDFDSRTGRNVFKFRRPIAATDDSDLEITLDKPQTIIYSFNPDTPVFGDPHLPTTRGSITISWLAGDAQQTAVRLNQHRQTHGILMGLAFVLLLPMGALLARGLRYNFIQSQVAKALMFYMHVALQISGAAIATGGLVLALTKFKTKYYDVPYHHGQLGIAVMALVYTQVLIGVVRPPGQRGGISKIRRVWDIVHAAFGRLVLLLSIVNVFIGIHLYERYVQAFGTWMAVCAASVVTIAWLQQLMDRFEMMHVAKALADAKGPAPEDTVTLAQAERGTFKAMTPEPDVGVKDVSSSGHPPLDTGNGQQPTPSNRWSRRR